MYRRVKSEQALIRSGLGGTVISLTGAWVLPIIHRAQIMDISPKEVVIDRMGKQGLICKDCIRADIKFSLHVRVPPKEPNILQVYQMIGVEKASDEKNLYSLFEARTAEALKATAKTYDFQDLVDSPNAFRDQVFDAIGTDLNGFVLEAAVIEHLEQTPLEFLDPNNILDAEGIKKITNARMERQILENEIRRKKERQEAKEKAQRRI